MGYIVDYMPASSNPNKALPENAFKKIYNFENVEDGKYTFNNFSDNLVYSSEYRAGKKYAFAMKTAKINPDGRTTNDCTQWTLTVTYFYSDGISETYSYDLGITCNDIQNELANPDAGGGGGGGYNSDLLVGVPDEVERTWRVADDGNYGSIWYVNSVETLNGIKYPNSSPKKISVFTAIGHKTDYLVKDLAAFPFMTWQRTDWTKNLSPATATANIKGNKCYIGNDPNAPIYIVSNSKSWDAVDIWP